MGRVKATPTRLDDLTTAVVMVGVGAFRFPNKDRPRSSWMGLCQWCGKERWLQSCHIFPKARYRWMRWDPMNVWAGCNGCHMFRWHRDGDVVGAGDLLKQIRTAEQMAALKMRAAFRVNVDDGFREGARLWLERRLIEACGKVLT